MDALDRGPWQISCTASRLSGSNPPPVMTTVEFQKTLRPRRTVTDAQPHALPAALNRMLALGCPNYVRIG
jgi:hypothetical protein